jgi:hypothetical protein
MRTLLPLVRKEARDNRALVVASMVIAALISLAVQHWLMDYAQGAFAAQILVPALMAVFVAALASDLVAVEVATRRIEPMAMLPVPVSKLWLAKATYLALAGGGFLAFTAMCQEAVLRAAGADAAAAAFENAMLGIAPQMAAVFAFGAASLFFSTLLERGFAAVVAAIAVLAGIGFAVEWSAIPFVSDRTTAALRLAIPLVVGVAFTAASALAFIRGGVPMGKKLRPALIGLGATFAVLVPGGAAMAAWSTSVQSVRSVSIVTGACVSPNDKWVAVQTYDADGTRMWLVEIDTGRVRRVGDGYDGFGMPSPWSVESNLCIAEATFTFFSRESYRVTYATIEPSHVAVIERGPSPGPAMSSAGGGRKTALHDGRTVTTSTDGVFLNAPDGTVVRRLFPDASEGR